MRTTFLATLCTLALTACAAPSEGSSHLSNSTWQFTAIDDAEPVSEKAQLSFEEDSIGANVGCNGMGGPWRIENGRLIAGPLVQTQMYCEGPVWEQEKAIGALLAGAPKLTVEGDSLVLESSGHSAKLEKVE